MSRSLLITGATGEQGGSVIDALIGSPSLPPSTIILALTRNASSHRAQQLTQKSPAIKLVEGNLDDVPTVFDRALTATEGSPIWGVFSVQTFFGKGASIETEEAQGKTLVDESIKRGVRHFVYASVERGGDERSWENPTNVRHFSSKHRIEHHLHDRTTAQEQRQGGEKKETMTWTILGPTGFYQNIVPGFANKMFNTVWRYSVGETPLQLVSTRDIGWFGAEALVKPENYQNRAIGLAGDEMTFAQLDATFKKVTGHAPPTTFDFFAWLMMWALSDFGAMFRWFGSEGPKADLAEVKRLHPGVMSLEQWIAEESGFVHRQV